MPCDEQVKEAIKCMDEFQLVRLIEKGTCVEEVRAEWRKRWGTEYPYVLSVNGIKEYGR